MSLWNWDGWLSGLILNSVPSLFEAALVIFVLDRLRKRREDKQFKNLRNQTNRLIFEFITDLSGQLNSAKYHIQDVVEAIEVDKVVASKPPNLERLEDLLLHGRLNLESELLNRAFILDEALYKAHYRLDLCLGRIDYTSCRGPDGKEVSLLTAIKRAFASADQKAEIQKSLDEEGEASPYAFGMDLLGGPKYWINSNNKVLLSTLGDLVGELSTIQEAVKPYIYSSGRAPLYAPGFNQ